MNSDLEMEVDVLRGEVQRREKQIQQLRADLDAERYERRRLERELAKHVKPTKDAQAWCSRCQIIHALTGPHTRPQPIQASVEDALGLDSGPSGEGPAERDGGRGDE